MAKVTISENRLKSLLAAEEFCRAARLDYSDYGLVTKRSYQWFDRWMRLSGRSRYDKPKPTRPVWCSNCRKRHVSGDPCAAIEK